jgi:hypothetical protein
MQTKIEDITPAIASNYLTHNKREKQRNLVDKKVYDYASAMRSGHWVLNHQGIAFDAAGDLCDGQHRLTAVVVSGVTVKMMVTRGLQEKQGELFTFDSIDVGMKRSVGSSMTVRHGVENAILMAAGCRSIAIICNRGQVAMSVASTMAIMDHFGADLKFILSHMTITRMKSGQVLGTLAFCRRAVGNSLDKFIEQVGSGEGITKMDPAHVLRNYILNNRIKSGPLTDCQKAVALCAWHFISGNKMKMIRSTMAGLDFFCDKQPRIVESIRKMMTA